MGTAKKEFATGLLDLLRANPERAARAREMGHDPDAPLFAHGTRANIGGNQPTEYGFDLSYGDLGTHIGTLDHASNRLLDTQAIKIGNEDKNYRKKGDYGDDANIIPVMTSGTKNPLRMPDLGNWKDSAMVLGAIPLKDKKYAELYLDAQEARRTYGDNFRGWNDSPENREILDEINRMLQEDGYDSVVYENKYETSKGLTPEAEAKYKALRDRAQELERRYNSHPPIQAPNPKDYHSEEELKAAVENYLDSQSGKPAGMNPRQQAEVDALWDEASMINTDPANRYAKDSYIILDNNAIKHPSANFLQREGILGNANPFVLAATAATVGGGMALASQKSEAAPVAKGGKGGLLDILGKLDQGKLAKEYPEVGEPELKWDKKKKKEYLGKGLSDEEKLVQKARNKYDKEHIETGDYDPYFDELKRYYADPSLYNIQGDTLIDTLPKMQKTIDKHRAVMNTPEIRQKVEDAYNKGSEHPSAHDWYAMGQLQDEFIKELGVVKGAARFKEFFADAMAATTGGADPTANLLMSAYGNFQRTNKLRPAERSYDMPHPIGGRYVSGNMEMYDKVINRGEDFTAADQPKRHNFRSNFLGYLDRATMDEQMTTGMIDKTAPPQGTYGILEQNVHDVAAKKGVKPAQVQDVAWAGFKDSEGYPMIRHINEMLARTAAVTGKTQKQVLKGFIRGNMPMYGLGGAMVAGGLLSAAAPQQAQAGPLAPKLGGTQAERFARAAKQGFTQDAVSGSTWDFTAFDGNRASNINDWGKGSYASNTIEDVNANYAGVGPDLQVRIDEKADEIQEDIHALEGEERAEMLKKYGISKQRDEMSGGGLLVQAVAKDMVKGPNDGVVYPLKIRTDDFVRIGGPDSTVIDSRGYTDFDPETGEGGSLARVRDALMDTEFAEQRPDAAFRVIEKLYDRVDENGNISADDLNDAVRAYAENIYDSDGEMMTSGGVSAQVFQNLGFKGVADSAVDKKWGTQSLGTGMAGVTPDTTHFITFPKHEYNIRSALSADFNPANEGNPDMRGNANVGLLGATALGTAGAMALAPDAEARPRLNESEFPNLVPEKIQQIDTGEPQSENLLETRRPREVTSVDQMPTVEPKPAPAAPTGLLGAFNDARQREAMDEGSDQSRIDAARMIGRAGESTWNDLSGLLANLVTGDKNVGDPIREQELNIQTTPSLTRTGDDLKAMAMDAAQRMAPTVKRGYEAVRDAGEPVARGLLDSPNIFLPDGRTTGDQIVDATNAAQYIWRDLPEHARTRLGAGAGLLGYAAF